MTQDYRTIAFPDNAEREMMTFVNKHWDEVISVFYQTEYQHPGSHDAYIVKIKKSEKRRFGDPKISDIMPTAS